jgi:hypothetical protein
MTIWQYKSSKSTNNMTEFISESSKFISKDMTKSKRHDQTDQGKRKKKHQLK